MSIIRHKDLESCWSIAGPWQALTNETPLLSPDWLLSWWKHFGKHTELFVLEARNPVGNILGIAPLFIRKQFGNCELQTLGSGNVCTDYMKFISSPERMLEVTTSICNYLGSFFNKQPSLQTNTLSLEGIASGTPWAEAFSSLIQELGFRCWESPLHGSVTIDLPSTWEQYLANLSHSPKRKARKIISRLKSGEISFFSTSKSEECIERMPDLERLHQSRHLSIGQSGSYADPRFGPFLQESVKLLAERGKVSMQWCESEGQIISIHLVLLGGKTWYVYQSGIDSNFMALEPGHALTVSSIRHAIENGVRCYDLLRGEEPYKVYWGGKALPLTSQTCRPPQTISRVAGLTHQSFWQLKQSAKSLVGIAKRISQSMKPIEIKRNG